MCGIAGIIQFHGRAETLIPAVEKMTEAQRHRGPFGGEVYVASESAPSVVLGHRRLAIIDLSEAGRQPMVEPRTGAAIIYNGEIYNFQELRRLLEERGHRFTSDSDTEVILRGYLEWGFDMPARLRGIFAFALWDPRSRTMVLARDGLGIKPLYIHRTESRLIFASEVRAVLASAQVDRKLDVAGLRSYLAFGSVQEPMTLVEGVRSLAPGSMLIADPDGVRQRRFYSLPEDDKHRAVPSHSELRATLRDSVRAQLVADVPLGAFLSGGIDSSAIAALMAQSAAGDYRTFNVCFQDGDAFDERVYARRAAASAGTHHTEIELGEREFLDNLPSALAAYDQPSMDGVNTWFVSRAVRGAGLSVALAGVGGDELFVGYNRFAKAIRAQKAHGALRVVPPALRRSAGKWLELNSPREPMRQAGTLLSSRLAPYFSTRRLFGPHRSDSLLHQGLRDGGVETWSDSSLRPLSEAVEGMDPINAVSRLELRTYMLSTLLRDTDQMSMAHTLEVRVPLIDQSLVELVLPLPGSTKISRAVPKRLLVEPLADSIPPECVHRTKRGFTLPLESWLNSPAGAAATAERLRGYSSEMWPLDPAAIARLQREHAAGVVSWSRVWAVYVLRDWLTRHDVTL